MRRKHGFGREGCKEIIDWLMDENSDIYNNINIDVSK